MRAYWAHGTLAAASLGMLNPALGETDEYRVRNEHNTSEMTERQVPTHGRPQDFFPGVGNEGV